MDERLKDKSLRNELRKELDPFEFSPEMKLKVLGSIAKKPSFWKREVVIPAPVIAAVLILVLAVPIVGWRHAVSLQRENLIVEQPENDNIIVSAAGVFYESQLKKERER